MNAVVFLVILIAVLGVMGAMLTDSDRKREGRK